jgi:DNA-binding PadR family transcriptional regulator
MAELQIIDFYLMLELSVLSAVLQLGSNAYGVTIRDAVNSAQGRDISLSRIYSALERLEDAGFVTSHVGEATAERGNRPKRYYMITSRGSSRLLSDVSVNDYLVPA